MRVLLREAAGGLPRSFWHLWTGTLVNRIGSFVLLFLTIFLVRERGLTDVQAGLIIGLWGAGGAVGAMMGGILADRWGRRPTLLVSQLCSALLIIALGLSRGFWLTCACALALGLFAEAARPAFSAMMIEVVPEKDRVRAFSLNFWAHNLGFACSAVLAGLAAEADYLLLFLVDAATTAATALFIFVKVREPRAPEAGIDRAAGPRLGIGSLLRDRVFLGLVLANLLIEIVFLQHKSMLPIAMSDKGLSASTFGWVISLNGFLIVLGQLFVSSLIKTYDNSRVLALAAAVIGGGFALTAFADSAWLYAMTVLIWTVGEMLDSPSTAALVAGLSPRTMRGRYQGMFSLASSIAAFAAPVLGGLVRERFGDTILWIGTGAVAFAAAAVHLSSRDARIRRVSALNSQAEQHPSRQTG
ncbi:MDR family MFS transporter [Streptosporangium algeriense]|uniref:MDR family MFS transporter n=1 Tax=Streptosporangium algeriense TaxID=1682748 RepID=A0ABW3DQM0_9ACTN